MKWKAITHITVAGVLWGTIGIFVNKLSGLGLDSMQIIFLRAVVAAVMLLIYTFLAERKSLRINWKDLWIFIGTGVISFVFFNYCYLTSIKLSCLSIAAALLYTAPVFVVLFSAILFREKLTVQKLLAVIATVCGCMLLSGFGSENGAEGSAAGVLWGVASGLLYGLYSIFSQVGIKRGYQSMTITTYTFVFAAAACFFMVDVPQTMVAIASAEGIIWVLLLGIVTCLIPYLLYTKGLSCILPSTASVIATVEPAVACLIGIFYFNEEVLLFKILAIILILSAVVFLNLNFGRTHSAEEVKA